MLLATMILVLVQLAVAVASPARFIYLSLWIQTIPYTWNWNAQTVFDTPLGPLNVVAMQMFGFCLACLLVIGSHFDQAMAQAKHYKWHLAFIGFCMVSLVYASSTAYGLRMIAKMLGPFLFMIAILGVIRSELELRKMQYAILGSGLILVGLALFARAIGINSDPNAVNTGLSGLGPPGMGPPVFSAHMLAVAMLAFAAYVIEPRMSRLPLVFVSALAIVAALQRTSAAALYLGFSAILFFGTRGIWRLVLPILALLGLPTLLVFSATFRSRMFMGDANSEALLADPLKALGSVNGSGRFGLWDNMLQRFFDPHPIVGSGIGSTQDYLYSQSVAGAGVVHSEYVRLLCEVGVVGLVLFILAAISYLLRLQRYSAKSNGAPLRIASLAAIGGVVAYLVFFSTDNGFDYVTQFGIYVFALIAIADKSRQLASTAAGHEKAEALRPTGSLFPNLMN